MPRRSLALLALIAAFALFAGSASAKPPKTYKGSIVATTETDDWIGTPNPSHTSDRLEVTALKIKRTKYRNRGKREKAVYKVVSGTAHWTSTESGRCTHSHDQTFDIAGVMSRPIKQLTFERVARGPWIVSADLSLKLNAYLNATCVDAPGEEPWTKDEVLAPPKLLYTGDASAILAPKARVKHKFKDSITNSTTKSKMSWKIDWKG